jgi:uncharacterized protein
MDIERTVPAGPAGPVGEQERIVSIDVLRGFAVLGILVMNIQTFSMIDAAYFNPTAYGDLSGPNLWVWLLSHLLTDQKFMSIFSMLFGAGICLMAERAEATGRSAAGLHYRRMFWLILFGLLHAHLLWYGDILYLYGMCGLVVYLFRKLRPGWQIALGVVSLAVISLMWIAFGLSMAVWPAEAIEEFSVGWAPAPDVVAEEVQAYRGGWLDQAPFRSESALEFETFVMFIWGGWRAGGMMLIGMGLFRLGVFGAGLSRRFYLGLVTVALLIGLPVVGYGIQRNFAADWDVRWSFFLGSQFNHWGSVVVALGWVGLIMLICREGLLTRLRLRLAAVGRMALTNYLLQTLICTTLFYGHGLGLFGRVERVGQIAVVVGVWIVLLALSPMWLSRFRYGPFEWLWRSLTYLKLQPMRR